MAIPRRPAPASSRNGRRPRLHPAAARPTCHPPANVEGRPQPKGSPQGYCRPPWWGWDLERPQDPHLERSESAPCGGRGGAEVILWFVWGVVGLGKAKEVTPGDTPGGEDPSVPPTEPQDVSPLPELPSLTSTSLFNLSGGGQSSISYLKAL